MELLATLCLYLALFAASAAAIPAVYLYDHSVPEAARLPAENDVSSPEIKLKVPIVFFGKKYNSIFVNSNGFVSFETEIRTFFNVEFPLDYPLIAPFYTHVDTRSAGTISYYETNNQALLRRASDHIKDYFSEFEEFEATSVFIVTWLGVGYYNNGHDKTNTYQIVISTDGVNSFVEFLYANGGIQWIQGTGDESGLPDARAQVALISGQGKMFALPGSGKEQVRNLENWSNMQLPGQFIFRIDGEEIEEPDIVTDSAEAGASEALTCANAPTACHVQGKCIDYEDGFCCECKKQYYGNGKFCIKKDAPLRVNGKVTGKINGETLDNLDLQSYIVMVDGRAYTAMSKVPESIGSDIQSLQVIASVIGYVFAKPVRNSLNGYQLTSGVFNHTATITYLNSSQTLHIKQNYLGLNVFDQLRLEVDIQGEIPNLPYDAKVAIDEYDEQYTHTAPGVVQMSTTRPFKYEHNGAETTQLINIEQSFVFEQCKHENGTLGQTWKLRVGKNFISYESREQIIRFGLSNKVVPLGAFDPCEEGRAQCFANSVCVVDQDAFRCVCNPGFQALHAANGTACADVDECQAGLHSCDFNAQCVNEVGAFSCRCHPGFRANGAICESEYSCEGVVCNANAECVERNRVAECRCQAGYTGSGAFCTPLHTHDCLRANNCAEFGMCRQDSATGRHQCVCLPGYEGDGYACTKTETNSTEDGGREETQRCLLGVCWCPEGTRIKPNSTHCIRDTDTTTTEVPAIQDNCNVLNDCDGNAQCVATADDTFICQCNDGFSGDGHECTASTPSCNELNNCDSHATCIYDVTAGKSRCVCNRGHEGDGLFCRATPGCSCTDTEECLYTSLQRPECVCKLGYVRDSQRQCVLPSTCGGGVCVDTAECLYDDQDALYYCACKSGYEGDGITECKLTPVGCDVANNCGAHANCEYDAPTALYACKCEPGYHGDGFACFTERSCHEDAAMCDREAVCVADANRGFTCQCKSGFQGNGTICSPNPTNEGNFLLLNQGMATLKIAFEPSRKNVGRPIQIKLFQTAVGLDIDCIEGRVYWGDISGGAIRASGYNGSAKSDLIAKGIGSPEGLAVDWLSRNIYWTDSTKDTIEVASLDGKRRRVLFNTELVNPRGIAVHPQRGKIFWTDWDRTSPKIEWANADGSDRRVFLQGETVSLPNSLTIDFETEQLCYADAGTKSVECVNIDNRARRVIATNCTYPFGITVTDTHIYWSDWITKQIERVDKATLERLPALKVPLGGTGNKLYGLVAVPLNCPPLANLCQLARHQCPPEHVCLPNGSGSRSCVCTFNAQDPSDTPSCNL